MVYKASKPGRTLPVELVQTVFPSAKAKVFMFLSNRDNGFRHIFCRVI